jgi:hypothetical protein
MSQRLAFLMGGVVAVLVTLAGCMDEPTGYDPYAGGGGASSRCRPDPDDPKPPGRTAIQDREWEDPNDDGRPT